MRYHLFFNSFGKVEKGYTSILAAQNIWRTLYTFLLFFLFYHTWFEESMIYCSNFHALTGMLRYTAMPVRNRTLNEWVLEMGLLWLGWNTFDNAISLFFLAKSDWSMFRIPNDDLCLKIRWKMLPSTQQGWKKMLFSLKTTSKTDNPNMAC